MDEFIICEVCMEIYDGGLRCPRMFTCGHSFCSSCIQKMLTTCLFCPTCKMPIENKSMETISINYILKQMAEKYSFKSASEPSGSIVKEDSECKTHHQGEPSSKGYCKVHKVPKRFRCMTCKIWICGDCAVISHKLCKTLLVKEAIVEIKKGNYIKIRKHLETISEGEVDSLNLVGHYKGILGIKNEELQSYQQKIIVLKEEISEVNRNIEKVSDLQTVLASLKEKLEFQMMATNAASSVNDLDKIEKKLSEHFRSLKEFTENLKFYKSSMLQNTGNENKDHFGNKEKLMASVTAGEKILVTSNKDDITRYGELDVKEGIFRIHSMHQTNNSPSSLCITLDNCLKTMTGRKEWPTKIFLQFSSLGYPVGNVIIRLQESSKEVAKTVLPLCLFGEEGKSFKGVRMCGSFTSLGFIASGCTLPLPSDVDFIALSMGRTKKKWNEREMGLHVVFDNTGIEFLFFIVGKDSNCENEWIPTGQVEKGIDVIKDVCRRCDRGEEVTVLNCGWVLN